MTIPKGRCHYCYRKVAKRRGYFRQFCCLEHRALALRVRAAVKKAAEDTGRLKRLTVQPPAPPTGKTQIRLGRKKIPCIMCGTPFVAVGRIVGGRVIPNERTCPTCIPKRDRWAAKMEPEAIHSPLSTILDGFDFKKVLRHRHEPKSLPG